MHRSTKEVVSQNHYLAKKTKEDIIGLFITVLNS